MTAPTFEVRFTQDAEDDLESIHDYVATHRSGDQADALLGGLLERIATLETFPMRGAVPEELADLGSTDFRQQLHGPYRLIYRVIDKVVFVVVIADGRRDMQALLERRLLGR